MNKLIRRSLALVACALPIAAAAACDGDVTYSSPVIEETEFAASLGVDLASSTKTSSGMYYRDLTAGTGVTAAANDTAYVHYTVWLSTGQQVDTNSGNAASYGFILGRNMVIPGFDEGVRGMKKGGSRQLILPPELAYGRASQPRIPGNSILVFSVLVDSIK